MTQGCRCGPSGDKLVLRGLKFHGFHGVYEEERKLGQKFVVDVDAWLDLSKAGETDSLAHSVSYAELYRIIRAIVEGPPFLLLERVASSIASQIFVNYPTITDVRVKIGKPHVAVEGAVDYLGVEILRTRPGEIEALQGTWPFRNERCIYTSKGQCEAAAGGRVCAWCDRPKGCYPLSLAGGLVDFCAMAPLRRPTEALDCEDIASRDKCKSFDRCKWCTSLVVHDACFSVIEARRLPVQVFDCKSN